MKKTFPKIRFPFATFSPFTLFTPRMFLSLVIVFLMFVNIALQGSQKTTAATNGFTIMYVNTGVGSFTANGFDFKTGTQGATVSESGANGNYTVRFTNTIPGVTASNGNGNVGFTKPTGANVVFANWTDGTREYASGETINVTRNLTLTAQWVVADRLVNNTDIAAPGGVRTEITNATSEQVVAFAPAPAVGGTSWGFVELAIRFQPHANVGNIKLIGPEGGIEFRHTAVTANRFFDFTGADSSMWMRNIILNGSPSNTNSIEGIRASANNVRVVVGSGCRFIDFPNTASRRPFSINGNLSGINFEVRDGMAFDGTLVTNNIALGTATSTNLYIKYGAKFTVATGFASYGTISDLRIIGFDAANRRIHSDIVYQVGSQTVVGGMYTTASSAQNGVTLPNIPTLNSAEYDGWKVLSGPNAGDVLPINTTAINIPANGAGVIELGAIPHVPLECGHGVLAANCPESCNAQNCNDCVIECKKDKCRHGFHDCEYCNPLKSGDIIIEIVKIAKNDFIKVHNMTNRVISTKGLFLTNDADLFKWQMPSLIITSKGFALIKGDDDTTSVTLKRATVNFNLSGTKTLCMTDADEKFIADWNYACIKCGKSDCDGDCEIVHGKCAVVTDAGPGFAPQSERVGVLRTVNVSSQSELVTALASAKPGDEIVLKGGVYLRTESGKKSSRFHATVAGTAKNPIYLRSADPKNPAILDGGNANSGCTLYLDGAEYWVLEDLEIRYAQKGLILDKSSYSVIRGCYVYNTGEEAVAIRDGSSKCLIEYTKVTDTGINGAIYSEGIYIGSAYNNWSSYSPYCDGNVVSHCLLGPNILAKAYTDKEGCTGSVVQCTTFYGKGMKNVNSARSFMELQGNETIVRYNTFYRQDNEFITTAIKIYEQQAGWGQRHDIYKNTFHLDVYTGTSTGGVFLVEIVSGGGGSCRLSGNVTYPAQCLTYYRPTNILTSKPGAITVY